MKAKLIINDGREIEIDISEEELVKFKPKMKTGYERVVGGKFWAVSDTNCVYSDNDIGSCNHDCDNCSVMDDDLCMEMMADDDVYDNANYYSDRTVAENNARADKLMRQLRRFAVENRVNKLNWRSGSQNKYCIYFDYGAQSLLTEIGNFSRRFGSIYFDSRETAKLAIDTFREELTWYFMEYKDSL